MARTIAPGIVRGGHDPGDREQDERGADRRPAEELQAVARQARADGDRCDADDQDDRRPGTPAPDDLGGLLAEPALVHDMLLELLVELGGVRPELRDLVGLDEALGADPLELPEGKLLGRGQGPTRCLCPLPVAVGVHPDRRPGLDADLATEPEQAAFLAEREQPPAGKVEQGSRQGPAGGLAVEDERARRCRQLGRRCGDVDRGVVEVFGIAAVPEPRPGAPCDEAEEHDRRADQAHRGVELAGALEPCGVLGRRRRVDLLESRAQCPVQISPRESRDHVLVEDPLALAVVEVGGAVSGRRVELDLAVDERGVDVEQDGEAVVEALPPHAPLVDQRDARAPRPPPW